MTRAIEISDARQREPVAAVAAALAGHQAGVLEVAEDGLQEAGRDALRGRDAVAGERLGGDGGEFEGGSNRVVDPGSDAHGRPSCLLWEGGRRVPAAFHHCGGGAADRRLRRGARARPPLGHAAGGGRLGAAGARRLLRRARPRLALADPLAAVLGHRRGHAGRRAGGLGDRRCPGVLGGVVDQVVLRRRILRAMQSHLDAYAAAAARAALDVVQVVGAAIVDGDRVLVAQRSGGPYDGCWEFPGGKVEPGESDLSALVREIGEELGDAIVPQAFLGEVVLDGVVGGGPPGTSTLRRVVGPALRRGAGRARARGAALGAGRRAGRPRLDRRRPPPPPRRPRPPHPPLTPTSDFRRRKPGTFRTFGAESPELGGAGLWTTAGAVTRDRCPGRLARCLCRVAAFTASSSVLMPSPRVRSRRSS